MRVRSCAFPSGKVDVSLEDPFTSNGSERLQNGNEMFDAFERIPEDTHFFFSERDH